MPVIVESKAMKVEPKGSGWTETTIADRQIMGTSALVARRWSFKPGASSPEIQHGDQDEMLYVIAGSGIAQVGSALLSLEPETILWLEPDDYYTLQAGDEGLEILQGVAPGE